MIPKIFAMNGLRLLNRKRIGEGIYLLYFALMMGARAFGLYEGMLVYNITLVIGIMLFLAKMIITEHSIKEYAISGLLLLIAGGVYANTGEKGLIVCFTMMLGMKAVSVRKTIETGIITASIIIIPKIFLGVFGFTSEIYYPQQRAGVGVMFRHSLGYAHPNTLHMNVLMLSIMIMYFITASRNRKAKKDIWLVILSSVAVLLFNIYIFQYSGSRTGVLACLVYLIVNYWFFMRGCTRMIERVVVYAAFPVVCFVSIVLPFLIDGKLFDFVNKTVFNTRFAIARYFWSNNTISLWGIRLKNPVEGYSTYGIDMAQLYLFLQLGVVAFLTITVLTLWFVYMCIKHNRNAELAVLIGMLFLGMWEPLLYNLGFKNFVYVFMGAMLYGMLNDDYSYLDEGGIGILEKLSAIQARHVVRILSLSALVGALTSMCFLMMSPKPSALYGDREENEAGYSFGMEALYLSEEQIESFEAEGDIVIGYVDETKPMYRYDDVIAEMEYEKKIISYGVWSGLLVAVIGYFVVFNSRKSKKWENVNG